MKFTYLTIFIAGSLMTGECLFGIRNPFEGIFGTGKTETPTSKGAGSWSQWIGNMSDYMPKLPGVEEFLGGKGSLGFMSPPMHSDCPETNQIKHRGAHHGEHSISMNKYIDEYLGYLKKALPDYINVLCLVRHFTNFDNFNKFLSLLESLIFSCRNRKPSESECKTSASFASIIGHEDFVSPVKWPCLQKSLTADDFYIQLNLLYEIINPCAPHAPKLDLSNTNRTAILGDAKVGTFIYALWWFWWYFISGQVVFVLLPRNRKLLKVTTYEEGLLFGNEFNASKPTKILIHGYVNYYGSLVNRILKTAYSKPSKEGELPRDAHFNMILVDWSSMSFEPYPISRSRIIPVAKACVTLISRLVEDYGVTLDSIHILGHSLGAHIAGITGHLLQEEKSKPKIRRITGLDPALPLFYSTPPKWQISKESAAFVDIIHTTIYTLGIGARAGHADFYPNGGLPYQPGCGVGRVLNISRVGLVDFGPVCSHYRAIMYYAESIHRPKALLGRRCSSFTKFKLGFCNSNPVAYMGEYASTRTRGIYYFNTGPNSPYGLGRKGI